MASTKFEQPKELLAKLITEGNQENSEVQILSFRQNNSVRRGGNNNGFRGHYNSRSYYNNQNYNYSQNNNRGNFGNSYRGNNRGRGYNRGNRRNGGNYNNNNGRNIRHVRVVQENYSAPTAERGNGNNNNNNQNVQMGNAD